jgi:hypothetical protein
MLKIQVFWDVTLCTQVGVSDISKEHRVEGFKKNSVQTLFTRINVID